MVVNIFPCFFKKKKKKMYLTNLLTLLKKYGTVNPQKYGPLNLSFLQIQTDRKFRRNKNQ